MSTVVAALVTAFLLVVVILQIAGQALRHSSGLLPALSVPSISARDTAALTAWYGANGVS